MNNPCYGCQKRHAGCQIGCKDREGWLKEHKDELDRIRKQKQADGIISEYVQKEKAKAIKYKHRKRRS